MVCCISFWSQMVWSLGVLWISSGYTVLYISVCLLLVWNRNIQPLKFRGPWLLLLSAIGGFCSVAFMLMLLMDLNESRIGSHTVCIIGEWITWVTYPAMVLPYLLRALRMFYIFRSMRSERYNEDSSQLKRLVITESFLLKIFTGVLFLITCVKVMRDLFNWNVQLVGMYCGSDSLIGFMVVHSLEAIVLLAIILKLYNYRDDYGVAFEMTLVCGVWILGIFAQFIAEALYTESAIHTWFSGAEIGDTSYYEFSAIVVIVRNTIIFAISIVYPVYQSFAEPFVPLWSNSDALRSLDTLLKDIVCIQYFRQFLTFEQKVENMLCWVEIELFQDGASPQLMLQAQRIYDKYLSPDAELEVRIPDDVKARVFYAIEQDSVSPDTFGEVQHEIFLLMNEDFPRFLASESCKQCLRELEREEQLRFVLEKSQMIS